MNQIVVKTHYSATELAALRLPGLPATKVGVRVKAEREDWTFVQKVGTGGQRREYAPPAAIVEAIKSKAALHFAATVQPKTLPALTSQSTARHTQTQSLVGDARKGVLEALNGIMERTGYPLKKAARHLLVLAREGEATPQLVAMLKLARDARGRQSPDGLPSERSLSRFVDYNKGGALVPKKREADMTVPAWASAFMAFYQRPEKPTVEHAYRQFAATNQGELPSIHQVRRFLDKVGAVALQTGRMGSRELKTIKKFIRRTFDKLLPSDIYSADGHCFDAEVQHPFHGRPFRPEITSVVDIATRRLIGWSVDLAESSLAVLDALRVSALTGGIPAILYVDNGSGYVNQMMNDTATGLLARLGTEMVHSLPYNSQARGVIERLHKTIWVDAAKEVQGYIGRDMDRQAKQQVFKMSRQALTAKNAEAQATPLMPWHLFLEFCAEKAAAYNAKPHRSLPKIVDPATGRRRWMSPDEAWALAELHGFVAERITEEDARPLFRPQTTRTVRRCEIELFTNRYFNAALEEFHGDKLRVAYDLHDPQQIWVYADDGRLICTAELDANARDYMPQSFVEQARDKRAAGRQNRLEVKLEEVRAERNGTPALEIMERVTIQGGIDQLRQKWANERELELVPLDATDFQEAWTSPVARVQPAPAEESNVIAIPETPQARFQKWLAIDQLLKEGGNLEDAKLNRWYGSYPQTSEHRSLYKRHLAMQDGQSTVWEAIRKIREGFTQAQLAHMAKVSDSIAQDYVKALCKAGFVVVVGKEPVGRICQRFTYNLARDNGVEAPRLNKAGQEVVQGGINEAMWGTLRRVLKGQPFNYRELASFASTVTQVVPELTAKTYVLALSAAGYLDCVQPAVYGKRAALARYRLKREMESGPRAPMIQRTKVVYDPNWNRVVWTQEKGAEDEVL